MQSFSKKILNIKITLLNQNFESTGTNNIELEGFRSSVLIERAGGVQLGSAKLKIYGLPQADMDQITTIPYTLDNQNKKIIEIVAKDEDESFNTLIFKGDVIQAWGAYQQMPNVYLHIEAVNNYYNLMDRFPISSYKGGVPVATVIEDIANNLGLHFVNNGVDATLSN